MPFSHFSVDIPIWTQNVVNLGCCQNRTKTLSVQPFTLVILSFLIGTLCFITVRKLECQLWCPCGWNIPRMQQHTKWMMNTFWVRHSHTHTHTHTFCFLPPTHKSYFLFSAPLLLLSLLPPPCSLLHVLPPPAILSCFLFSYIYIANWFSI